MKRNPSKNKQQTQRKINKFVPEKKKTEKICEKKNVEKKY